MEVSIFQVFGAEMAMGEALVQLFQRVLITFPLISPLPFCYSVPNSDPQIKMVFYSLVLKPQIADINYQDVLRGKQGFGRTTEVLFFSLISRFVQHAGLLLGSPLGGDKSELCYRGWVSGKATLCCWYPPLHPVPMSHW